MPDYLITPKAPLIFRDGKPFGTSDNIAHTLAFPLPSTIAGAMRTAWAENQAGEYNYIENAHKLIKKRILGPLLTRTCIQCQTIEVLFPTPADSLCLNHKTEGKKIYRLYPDKIKHEEEGTDLPGNLLPIFLEGNNKEKPANKAPKFWNQTSITNWLIDETTEIDVEQQTENLPIEIRSHVAITPETQTNRRGHLFQTAGLDYNQAQEPRKQSPSKEQLGWQTYEYGLLNWFQEEMPDSYRTIGGETRLGHIQQQDLWPECDSKLSEALSQCQSFRLILATPAIFNNGYLPEWLNDELKGKLGNLEIQLQAVSIQRWQAGTSWDMADPKSKQGKGMRTANRLPPAGSVYWFDILKGNATELKEHWLTSISDQREQDGFGLVLPGIWTKTNNIKESL